MAKQENAMSNQNPIKTPDATSALGLYVTQPIGMDHPFFMAKMQARLDAIISARVQVPIEQATKEAVDRARDLFGATIPTALVEVETQLVYAQDAAERALRNGERTDGGC